MSDCIDRQTIINLLTSRAETLKGLYGDLGGAASGVRKLIQTLPSVELERTAKAEMLEEPFRTSMTWEGKCSNCGCYTIHEMNYCFGCGAKLYWGE